MMECKNLSKKQKVSGVVGLIIIVIALVGGIMYSKQAKAEEATTQVAVAPEATRINVSDEAGIRACDIYQGTDGTTKEQIEAFAKRTGCKLNAWRKDVTEKFQHKAPEAANDEKVAPAAPTLNVVPAPAQKS
jgi:hypothetical protein